MAEQTASANSVMDGHSDTTEGISLLKDEVVLANVHPSWANWLPPVGLAVVFGLAALGALSTGDIGTFFGELVIAGIFVSYVHIARSYSRYIVTNQRVKKSVGLLSTSTGETKISDIRALTTQQGFVERLLDNGSVKIDSAGEGGFIAIRGVADPEDLAELIREQY